MFLALLSVIDAGQPDAGSAAGRRREGSPVPGSAVSGPVSGIMAGNHSPERPEAAVTVKFTVTVRQVLDDGSEAPLDEELAQALAAPLGQFAGLAAWTADEARYLDHGDREKVIAEEGRRLSRDLLQATFELDALREEKAAGVTSAAGIRHGNAEKGTRRGLASIFGPVTVTRIAYRNWQEPALHPLDARQALPDDPYSLGMRALAARHLARSGFGQAQEDIEKQTGTKVGVAQLAGIADDLARWTGDFYEERARDADEDPPATDVIMMQADGKGIAMRPEHRKNGGTDPAHPGVKKMAEIVAVADFAPAARQPEDIAAPPARRKAHPGPKARDKWVSASVTESIAGMIAAAYDEADRRDPQHARQRVFLVDGNKEQITAIQAEAKKRKLKVPVLIDYLHVAGYVGKAAACLHPGDPAAARQWADGQLLRVLHGRAKAVAATLASVARKTRASTRQADRDLDLADLDRAVTYLQNNQQHMKYDKALENGWPIATGLIEGSCRYVIEDRFGITGARWSPDGAETILKLRAVVVNDDLDDYMDYYKNRYRAEHHLARYDQDTIERLNLAA
jgi:hypothetical protein